MGKSSFKDSLKALEADIQLANTVLSDYPMEKDGTRLQMTLSYSAAARFFLCFVQWSDCHLVGALGLLRIIIYTSSANRSTTMPSYERKATIREFYAILFPSLLQLRPITDYHGKKQKEVCSNKYKRKDESQREKFSQIDIEREEECGICLEPNSKIILPNCNHSLCLECYQDWHVRSQSCPFCRDSLRRVNSGDLWIYTDKSETIDSPLIVREDCKRLFMYIDNLPRIDPDPTVNSYSFLFS